MESYVPIIFLAVVLKIPVAILLYLVWWAVRAQPEVEEAPGDAGEHGFRRLAPAAAPPPRPSPRPARPGRHAAARLPARRANPDPDAAHARRGEREGGRAVTTLGHLTALSAGAPGT